MGTWNVTDQKVRLVATACNKRWDSPSGKKEKADGNVSLSIIHSTSEWLERKKWTVLWRTIWRSMRSSAGNEASLSAAHAGPCP